MEEDSHCPCNSLADRELRLDSSSNGDLNVYPFYIIKSWKLVNRSIVDGGPSVMHLWIFATESTRSYDYTYPLSFKCSYLMIYKCAFFVSVVI